MSRIGRDVPVAIHLETSQAATIWAQRLSGFSQSGNATITDFSKRLANLRAGYKIALCPEHITFHVVSFDRMR
jgi:hypothetical protein